MVTMSVGSPLHWTLGLSLKGINPKEGLLARSVEQLLVHVSISLQPIPRGLGYRQATPILTCFHKRNGVYSTIVVFIIWDLAWRLFELESSKDTNLET
jgi:hypothetical protein